MTVTALSRPALRRGSDAYLVLLACVLAGYAVFGKGFAYLGIAPLYIGELTLLIGAVIALRAKPGLGFLTTIPALFLLGNIVWALCRTIPFLGEYGADALRDSVVVMYGSFALIVIVLLTEDPRRIDLAVRSYRKFLNGYVPAAPFLFAASWYLGDWLPMTPGSSVSFIHIDPGEAAAHATGAMVFALVGFRRVTPVWLVLVLASAGMVGALSRGPMLAEILPATAALLLLGKWRQLVLTAFAAVAIFAAAYVIEPLFVQFTAATSSVDRQVSTRQVVNNIAGVIGQGDDQGEGTKEWRKEFWHWIIDDTVHGPNFWTGRGFGVNLADTAGFRSAHDTAALRDPHNVLMTMLGRAGVPGLTLWLCTVLSALGLMVHTARSALRAGQGEWAGLLIFTSCYASSILINAGFDPALTGPMQGIWFWCLIGFGIGSAMIFRHQQQFAAPQTAGERRGMRPRGDPFGC